MSEIILTQAKYDELSAKLRYLENEGRVDIAQRIKTAREFGDLSENAEYSAAREAQAKMETEILELSDMIQNAVVIEESSIKTNKVGLGNKVLLLRTGDNKEMEFQIVSSSEANSMEGKLSDQSPIGRAIVGRKKDDVVDVKTPKGTAQYKIVKISK